MIEIVNLVRRVLPRDLKRALKEYNRKEEGGKIVFEREVRKGQILGTLVVPYLPDRIIVDKDEITCIWQECPNVFGRYSKWEVTITRDGTTYVSGEGGSEHVTLDIVAKMITEVIWSNEGGRS